MLSCSELKKGQIYACEECGIRIQIVQECEDCGEDDPECGCVEGCDFSCCGEPLTLVES